MTQYERGVKRRGKIRFLLGLIVRWRMRARMDRLIMTLRKGGATIGERVSLTRNCRIGGGGRTLKSAIAVRFRMLRLMPAHLSELETTLSLVTVRASLPVRTMWMTLSGHSRRMELRLRIMFGLLPMRLFFRVVGALDEGLLSGLARLLRRMFRRWLSWSVIRRRFCVIGNVSMKTWYPSLCSAETLLHIVKHDDWLEKWYNMRRGASELIWRQRCLFGTDCLQGKWFC